LFGSLAVSGDMTLSGNRLESLPESFGRLTVSGEMWLKHNPVTEPLNKNSFPGLALVLTDDLVLNGPYY